MTTDERRHVPVLLQQAIRTLNVRAGGTYVDATLGMAGHSLEIARRLAESGGPRARGTLIGFDRDPEAMTIASRRLDALREELGERMPEVVLHSEPFSMAKALLEPASVDGLLADVGVSSLQLNEAHRGFSFQADGDLDMRMDTRRGHHRRTSGKSGRRKGTCRSDLRIRRGKEVAENRQSHCQGAADYDDGTTCPDRIGCRPGDETGAIASGDQNLPGASNSRE